jgi:hypothetical protein
MGKGRIHPPVITNAFFVVFRPRMCKLPLQRVFGLTTLGYWRYFEMKDFVTLLAFFGATLSVE